MMSQGAMWVWFSLTALSVAFVAIDIRTTPAHPVLKWAFVILAFFTGPFAAFFYVLGCREPLKGKHEEYVSAKWRQVLGSTMHCAAGDGLGIIAGAAVAARFELSRWADLALEYALGFGFGWAIFQALAMRSMAGGSYARSLRQTFYPEFVSMNVLMAGMVVTMHGLMPRVAGSHDPLAGGFWFVMSLSLVGGFVLAYPVNWWLVGHGLKHGMITVRPDQADTVHGGDDGGHHDDGSARPTASAAAMAAMATLSVAALALGIAVARMVGLDAAL